MRRPFPWVTFLCGATLLSAQTSAIVVAWPPERLPRRIVMNGETHAWKLGAVIHSEGTARFGPGFPISSLDGPVELRGEREGWRLSWTAPVKEWVAAATLGELGEDAPFEAKRALAAVLLRWIAAPRDHRHPDGSLCPLTHCAVVRGAATASVRSAVDSAPGLALDPDAAFYTGSKGGVSLSPRAVWGGGSDRAGGAAQVPGDRWATWTRQLSAIQVRGLKAMVKPGLKPGQKGMLLGPSGPYAVEELRLACGRRWGWSTWPSNACEGELLGDGSLRLTGHGWGHNVGLCLATAIHRARQGWKAEAILGEAFGADGVAILPP